MTTNHTHNPEDKWIVIQRTGGYEEEFFCLKCAKPLVQCQFCNALES